MVKVSHALNHSATEAVLQPKLMCRLACSARSLQSWCRCLAQLNGIFPVLILHSFRPSAIFWMTPTPNMASIIYSCHVFWGPRLLPCILRFITLWVTLFESLCWTCPNQRRRQMRITLSMGAAIFSMRKRYARDRAGWRVAATAVARSRMRLDGIR